MTTREPGQHTMPEASRAYLELTLIHVQQHLEGRSSMGLDDLKALVHESIMEVRVR